MRLLTIIVLAVFALFLTGCLIYITQPSSTPSRVEYRSLSVSITEQNLTSVTLEFELPKPMRVNVQVYNALGSFDSRWERIRLGVLGEGLHEHLLPYPPQLPPGLYTVLIEARQIDGDPSSSRVIYRSSALQIRISSHA